MTRPALLDVRASDLTSVLSAVGLLLSATSVAATAQELSPAVDWSGPYATFSLGGVHSDSEADVGDSEGVLLPGDVETGVLPRSVNGDETSGAVGFAVGTSYQRGPWVNSVEAGFNFLNHDDTLRASNDGPFPLPGGGAVTVTTNTSYHTEIDNLATLRWRGGFASGKNLFFASAGAAGGDVRNEFGFAVPNMPGGPYEAPMATEDGFLWGYVLGIGYERSVSDRISVRAEIVHFDLEDVTVTGSDPAVFPGESVEYEFENRGTMAMVGISFSF